jgi:hypothetical protein
MRSKSTGAARRITRALLLLIVALAVAGHPARAEHRVTQAETRAAAHVEVVHLPQGGVVPDIALDGRGVLHIVYGKGMDAYYTQSADGGKTLRAPVRLNRRPMTVTVGGERGPKLALGKDGVILVLWQGHYQKGGGIWVTRSTDGGRTFAPERNILDAQTGIDEPTLTADAQGNVIALWLDGRLPQNADNPVASPLFMARSTDNGATFGPNTALQTDFPGRGCSCCTLWARIAGPELYVAFRTGYHNIRDMYLLRGPKTGSRFQAAQISADHWRIEGCPMSGPRFAVLPASDISSASMRPILAAWMSEGKVYWTHSEDGGKTFAPRTPAPDGGSGNYPTILGNRQGEILLLWTREGQAQWALYSNGLSLPMSSGTAGATEGRPTAYVRPDGSFVVVL